MNPGTPSALPAALKRRWWAVVLAFGLAAIGGYTVLYLAWHPTRADHWGLGASGALLYLLGYTRVHLPLNRHHAEASVLPRLGVSNLLTLVRGLLYGLLAGFVVLPAPSGIWAFVPGVVYTVASLTDLADGHIARKRGETTDLGAKLDVEVDSFGILVAFILGVKFDQLPLVFAAVGGLFYAYRFYLWTRTRRGHPVRALPYSQWRSTIGGFEVGFLCVMLWPVFSPPYTTAVGAAIAVPVVASFVWDGMIATGRFSPDGTMYSYLTRLLRRGVVGVGPVVLRLYVGGAAVWLWWRFALEPASGGWAIVLSSLTLVTAGITAVGWKARWAALGLLTASAFLSVVVPPSAVLAGVVASAFWVMMVGGGYSSLDGRVRPSTT